MYAQVVYRPAPGANRHRNAQHKRAQWYAVDDDGKPAKMPCGVHLRPRNVPEDGPFYSGIYRNDDKGYYLRRLGPGEKHGDCICDYYNFSELLEERQGPHYTPKTFRLMDLPDELMLRIYEQVLVVEGGIEFCPEPFYLHRHAADPHVQAAVKAGFQTAHHYHDQRYQEKDLAHNQLMRVSKRVYKDASSVFFGGNEFRFSNSSGWFALDRFLYKLGMERANLLRHITVVHPDFTVLPTSLSLERHFWDAMIPRLGNLAGDRLATFFQQSRWFDAQTITPDPVLVLEKTKTLRNLRLLLPPTCRDVVNCPVNVDAFHNLRVNFAATEIPKLFPNHLQIIDGVEMPPARPDDEKTWAERAVEDAHNKAWRAELVCMDELGRYDDIGAGTAGNEETVADGVGEVEEQVR